MSKRTNSDAHFESMRMTMRMQIDIGIRLKIGVRMGESQSGEGNEARVP